jgi:N-acetylglucosaminyl-diphospho-decaprenol L-rhamnosyltransferase
VPADVTLTIVNHESRDAVLESLRELGEDRGRRARLQVIVVDNASQDGSVEAIRAAFPDVEVLARETRAGYGANQNLALARAEGRYVLFLNDDARVRPGAIDAMAGYLDAHPEVAVAAPTLVLPDGRTQVSLWPTPTPAADVLAALRLGRARPAALDGRRPQPVGWAMGCALLVRRDAARAAGGFDEGYFMYSEEVDLYVRLAATGGATHWVPDAEIVHGGQGSTGDSPERAIEMARSRRRYQERHYGRVGRPIARAALAVQFGLLALAARLRGRPWRAFALQALGAWREPGGPGLRERADAFNRERRPEPTARTA